MVFNLKKLIGFADDVPSAPASGNTYREGGGATMIDHFDVQKLMSFIGESESDNTYLHNTGNLGAVKGILSEGFWFPETLHKTTDRVNPQDVIEMNCWDGSRHQYGPLTVVIQINKNHLKKYGEEGLSKGSFENDDGDTTYILPEQFVKGYFNRGTNEGYLNPRFNASYDNPELAALNAKRFVEI
jgi:hypothetical protein